MKVKGIVAVIKELNILKKKKLIGGYAIGGGIAKNYYLEPQYTFDLDVFILISTMREYSEIYRYFRDKKCKIENVFIVINDIPVQFLPSLIHPLYEEAVKKAKSIRIDGVRTKVLNAEYLIAVLLMSFRDKDKYAIRELLAYADKAKLGRIIGNFSDKRYPILGRFKNLGGSG